VEGFLLVYHVLDRWLELGVYLAEEFEQGKFLH
jgi:hypothetical protein